MNVQVRRFAVANEVLEAGDDKGWSAAQRVDGEGCRNKVNLAFTFQTKHEKGEKREKNKLKKLRKVEERKRGWRLNCLSKQTVKERDGEFRDTTVVGD